MSLLLLSTSRVSEITNLRVDYLTRNSSVYTFPIPHLTKTCQNSKKPHLNLKFHNFPGDSKLYICKAIDSYLEKRNVWEGGVGESQFLISHIKPHKPVSLSTVSRWLDELSARSSRNVIPISQVKSEATVTHPSHPLFIKSSILGNFQTRSRGRGRGGYLHKS